MSDMEVIYHDYSSEGEEYWSDDDVMSSDSELLSLVQSYDWAGTLARIASYPDECKAIGVQGRTPLHVACDHDAPAVVVAALLKAYPEASLMVGTSNMNPLHITCSSQHASVAVVQALLEIGHDLQSSMRDVDGDTPLHAACRCGAPLKVLELLLRANPSAVNEPDYEGLTPLLRLWVRYVVILGDDGIDGVRFPADLTEELREAWKKTELLLQCAYFGSMPTSSCATPHYSSSFGGGGATRTSTTTATPKKGTFRAVHAAAAVDCPRAVVKIAAIVHPEQVEERDENGMTPLLIAAKAPIFKVRDLSDDGYMLEDHIHGDETYDELEERNCGDCRTNHNNNIGGGSDPQEVAQQPSVIEILVRASPRSACIPDLQGRLPLHMAIASGKRWNEGVRAILEACADGLSIPDGRTRLYPFMQAAVVKEADTDTILELLRRDPSLIRQAVRGTTPPLPT
jgi:ankyrin repeat protein